MGKNHKNVFASVHVRLLHSERDTVTAGTILTSRNRFQDLRIRQVIAQTTIINPALVPLDISGFVSKFILLRWYKKCPVYYPVEMYGDDDVRTFSQCQC